MFRVRVLLTSAQGNPKEIVTLCSSEYEAKKREEMYSGRYTKENGFEKVDIFIEEFNEVES